MTAPEWEGKTKWAGSHYHGLAVVRTSFDVEISGSGAPMLLLPGAACDGTVWLDTVTHYRDRFELHVVELAGFAGRPPASGPLLAAARRELAAYVTQELRREAVVVGHSLGAFLAFALAADAPEQVDAVVAIDGVPALGRLGAPEGRAGEIETTAAWRRDRLAQLSPTEFRRYLQSVFRTMVVDSKMAAAIAERGSLSEPKVIAGAMHELWTTDLRPELPKIRAPVLFVAPEWPDVDPGRSAARLASYRQQLEGLSNSREVVIAAARHFVMLDQPAALHREMDAFFAANAAVAD